MPVTLEQSEAVCLIRLQGEINISSAAEFKTVLLQALASGKGLQVELERATEMDVTAIQLLWAAGRRAKTSGVGFGLIKKVPENIAAAWSEAGFENFAIPLNRE